MEEASISDKIYKFESFVNDVLKEDLKKLETKLDQINAEISEYVELKNMVNTLQDAGLSPDGLKTRIDLGCNFYMQANIANTSQLYVDVGLGNYIELTLSEALKFCDMRISLLSQKVKVIRKECAKTKGHIKLVLHGIAELSRFPHGSVK